MPYKTPNLLYNFKFLAAIMISILIFGSLSSAFAQDAAPYTYENVKLGISFEIPQDLAKVTAIEERDNRLDLIYTPAAGDGWGGCVFSIEKVSPKKDFYSKGWHPETVSILAASANAYFVITTIGGVDSKEETRDAYLQHGTKLREAIQNSVNVESPDIIPVVDIKPLLSELESDSEPLTRAKFAVCVYEALDLENALSHSSAFTDVDPQAAYSKALGLLVNLGIYEGYPDGSFHPDQQLTRAEFVTILYRMLLIPSPIWYGEEIAFADVSNQHWAWNHLNCACQAGIMNGYADGTLRPDETISLFEAKDMIHFMLENKTPL